MGGYGSGRHTNRATTDECITIRLPDLKRLGMVKRHCMNRQALTWRCDGHITAQLTIVSDVHCRERFPCIKITGHAFWQKIDCVVSLKSCPMHFGGERWYAVCPKTGKHCTTLVLPPGKTHFASVSGWDVAYGSQRECEVHRAYRAIDNASSSLRTLSKYARKPTRERLELKLVAKRMFVEEELERLASRFF